MEEYMNFIEVNPQIMLGKPVIKGTRITVEQILEELSIGKTIIDLQKAYPNLQAEQIQASLAFAADALKGERIYALSR